uniref:E3 ubiquitin-protein ligase PPP1R11 isoform X1 n=1 Tax=Callithrix jacchus TaxID=9483 RepID=UPI0008401984|nr:E3 ubiquitin-protein ligase PPP1R11 isoform X1 [Callithrix jacchus]
MIWGGRQRNSKDYIFLQRVAGTFPRRTGALPSNFGNGSQRKRWNGQVTLWTMNTWAAAHQNAAVFMRNLGPLVRALRKVMRRKKRAVVIHTVYVATAKDGVVHPWDRPPLPSLLTLPSPHQGQCSTKFLSTQPFLCLSGPECIHVATSPAPSFPLFCLIEGRGREEWTEILEF